METITRTSVTGAKLVYQVLGYKVIGTCRYAICKTELGATVLLPA